MLILSINKRLYTNKDVLDDKYGRLYEIPLGLAKLGDDVECVTISYRRKKDGPYILNEKIQPKWYSANLTPSSLAKSFKHMLRLVKKRKPDMLWAGSDVLHIAIGLCFSKRFKIPLFVDFYDNYGSFALTKIPGANLLLRQACKHATGITVASSALLRLVELQYSGENKTFLLPNGVPKSVFRKQGKASSRNTLRLPEDAILIGTAGSLDKSRGISTLYSAFLLLAEKIPNAYLVLAGKREANQPIPKHPRIIDLGVISFEAVPILYSALDVGVICNKNDDFGNYCSPMKAEEMIACELSTVAARTTSAEIDLEHRGAILYEAENQKDLAAKIALSIEHPIENINFKPRYWDEITSDLSFKMRIHLKNSRNTV